jgi:hypothetical protein
MGHEEDLRIFECLGEVAGRLRVQQAAEALAGTDQAYDELLAFFRVSDELHAS